MTIKFIDIKLLHRNMEQFVYIFNRGCVHILTKNSDFQPKIEITLPFKTISSTPSDTVTNEVVDAISFYITKINKGNDRVSNYNYIRCKLSGSVDTMWTVDNQYRNYVISGFGTPIMKIKLRKEVYYVSSTIGVMAHMLCMRQLLF